MHCLTAGTPVLRASCAGRRQFRSWVWTGSPFPAAAPPTPPPTSPRSAAGRSSPPWSATTPTAPGSAPGSGRPGSTRGWSRCRADVPLLVVDAHDTQPWADVQPDLVTPNFAEALRLLGAHSDQLSVSRPDWVAGAADRLLARAKARAMAVTLDVDGTVVLRENRPAHRTYARPVSASRAAGAGDAYVAAFTLALSTGAALAEAADVAQLAATVATCTASSSLGTGDPAGVVPCPHDVECIDERKCR